MTTALALAAIAFALWLAGYPLYRSRQHRATVAAAAFATLAAAPVILAGTVFSSPVSARQHELPACPYEDGNPNGLPCMWTSPSTGLAYYTDSSEYRNDNHAGHSPSVHNVAGPACQYEDGNEDGSPCTWFDPDTGDGYDVGSENYQPRFSSRLAIGGTIGSER